MWGKLFPKLFDEPERFGLTYHANEYENKLYDICVGHRVKTSEQSVDDGDGSRDPGAHAEDLESHS